MQATDERWRTTCVWSLLDVPAPRPRNYFSEKHIVLILWHDDDTEDSGHLFNFRANGSL